MPLLRRMLWPPLALFVLALLLIWVPLPRPFPAAGSNARNLVAAVVIGLLGLGYVVNLTIYAVRLFRQPGIDLGEMGTRLGLESRPYMLFGRSCSGAVAGRHVEVTFVPGRWPWPPVVDVTVQARVASRMALVRGKPWLDCHDCPEVRPTDPFLATLHVRAEDPAFAGHLLHTPAVREQLRSLITAQVRDLYLQPERIWLRASPEAVDQVERWLHGLLALARVVEIDAATTHPGL